MSEPTRDRGELGELLRHYRSLLMLSQEQLAQRAGLSTRTVRDIERGNVRQPHGDSVRMLARALNLADTDLVALRGAAASGGSRPPVSAARREAAVDDGVSGPSGGNPRPAQLPLDVSPFTGRAAELARLDEILHHGAGRPTAVVISAVSGMAGVGKTALAVHWARRVADRFPDGHLYVDLRGFDPGGSAMGPVEALRGLLEALGCPPERIPAGLDVQVDLYRSLVAQRRTLLLLDNARSTEQIRPLLPGSSDCMVLVTSRRELSGLVTTEGAHRVTLDLLSVDEAGDLFARRLGRDRLAGDPDAAGRLIGSCARLPLALSVAAARAAARPSFPLALLAADLDDARDALGVRGSDDAATDVRTVFSWTYRNLGDDAARLFRLLGLHLGPDIGVTAAASLVGAPADRVRYLLAELASVQLVVERRPGRFSMHDLLRAYAAELADRTDGEDARREALYRVLDHFLHTAHTAALLFNPHRDPLDLAPPRPGTVTEALADADEAATWFTAEHPALLAAIRHAGTAQSHTHAWQLAWTLVDFLQRRGYWEDQFAAQTAALDAARHLGDRVGQVHAHRGLGLACARLARNDEANAHLDAALDLARQLGDRIWPTRAQNESGRVLQLGEGLGRTTGLAEPASPAHTATGRPVHHLPLDVPDFTGRRRSIEELTGWLAGNGDPPASGGGVVVVTGKAGVGKTSLAVHVAHLLTDAFPDGRVLVNLGGMSARPVPPAEALTQLLLLLGTDRGAIAPDVAQRSDQYRSLLARRRVLVVLDNAADEAQVRPLLPWDGESAAVVTSRRPLAALEAAHRLTLPELDAVESVELLARIAGADQVAAELDAANRIVELCDRLPLAIRIAGARLVTKRHWTLAQLAARLAGEQRRLDELQVGDLAVRASLRLSYDALDRTAQHFFQVLGQLSGEGFPAWVPATLAGMTVPAATDVLEELVDRQLVDPIGPDHAGRQRYRLHDLLALLARELLGAVGSAPAQQAAKGQALQAWLTILDGMETRLVGGTDASEEARRPFTASYPLEWLPAQRAALAAGVDERTEVMLETGWSLTGVLVAMSFELWSQWDHWRMTRTVALHAGRRVDDRLVAAGHGGTLDRASLEPGAAVVRPGHEQPWAPVVASLERARDTFRSLGEVDWHAMAMLTLGNVYRAHARLDHAATTLQNCVELFRDWGHRNLEAAALLSQGSLRVVEGDLPGAVASYERCLAIFGDQRDLLWQAYTHRALGYAFQQHGLYADAAAELKGSLQVFRTHGDRMWEAHTLLSLGLARLGTGDRDAAIGNLTACIDIFREYGDPRSEAFALRGLAKATGGTTGEQHLLAALDGFLQLEYPIGVALTMYDLARLRRAQGKPAAADRCLRVYREICTPLNMPDLAVSRSESLRTAGGVAI